MSRKTKVIISVVLAVVLLTVGITTTVVADEPKPTPPAEGKGLLARVAKILGITEEQLSNAFKQAQQEMREEAFLKFLDKAVEKGRITQEEAKAIKQWWEQRPEALKSLPPGVGALGFRGGHMGGGEKEKRAHGFPGWRHRLGSGRGWGHGKPPWWGK